MMLERSSPVHPSRSFAPRTCQTGPIAHNLTVPHTCKMMLSMSYMQARYFVLRPVQRMTWGSLPYPPTTCYHDKCPVWGRFSEHRMEMKAASSPAFSAAPGSSSIEPAWRSPMRSAHGWALSGRDVLTRPSLLRFWLASLPV